MTIGFIGTGNMGRAIALAVSRSKGNHRFLLANRGTAKAQALASELENAAVCTNREAAAAAGLLFLAVKPQMMPEMLADITDTLKARQDHFVLVTMAAGLSCARIRELAGGDYPVIRIMPNTPASIGEGVVQVCSLGVTEEELSAFEKLLAPAGLVDRVEERLIDAASALSGCGPAFVCLFMEALADGAVACGLPRSKALAYAAQTLRGTASLALESGSHPGAMKDAVCSPGGTTIQGVRVLEEQGLRGAVMDAVIAAYEKTLSMK